MLLTHRYVHRTDLIPYRHLPKGYIRMDLA
jgi:hypothetical protein